MQNYIRHCQSSIGINGEGKMHESRVLRDDPIEKNLEVLTAND